jgi:HK97 family phage prohead protease
MRTRTALDVLEHQGIAVHVDRPIGSHREGVGPDGQSYRVDQTCDYGYLPGVLGDDGEAYDAYVGPSAHAPKVHVIRQLKAGIGRYDEEKAMLGFDSAEEAEAVYRAHVHPSMFGGIKSGTIADFNAALESNRAAGADVPFRWEPEEPAPPSSQRASGVQDKTMTQETADHAADVATARAAQQTAALAAADTGAAVPRPRGLCVRAAELSAVREDGREVDFIMSTGVKDSYGEIVRQNWRLTRFEKNPQAPFGHRSGELPIGQWLNVRVEDGALKGTLRVASAAANPLAENVWHSILEQTLRAVSVGFMPHKVSCEEIDGEEVVVLDDNELFECSVVPIPANPEALVEMRAKAHAAFAERRAAEERGAVTYEATPPKDTGSWDAASVVRRLRKWASSDGSGDAAHIDWNKYRKGFAWFDPQRSHEFGGFKLPHHDVVDVRLVTSRAGVIAAGEAIQGSRGGVKIPPADVAAVKGHLAKHYHQFDMKAPWEPEDKSITGPAGALNPKGIPMDMRNKDDGDEEMGMVSCPHCGENFKPNDEKSKGMIHGLAAKLAGKLVTAEREKHAASVAAEQDKIKTDIAAERTRADALQKRVLELELSPLNGVKFAPEELDGHVAIGAVFASQGKDGEEKWQKHLKALQSRVDLATAPGTKSILPAEKGAPRLGAGNEGDDILSAVNEIANNQPTAALLSA